MPDRGPKNAARLRSLLGRFRGRKIVVVGDVILDEYLIGDVSRISPEAPIPVLNLRQDLITPGAAAYVAGHVTHLGGEARLCGIVGDDVNGGRLKNLLARNGVPAVRLVSDPSRPTIVKTRVIARHQQMIRIDREEARSLSQSVTATLARHIDAAMKGADGVILSDYDKGTFTPGLIARIIRAARRARIPVAVNPKPRLALEFRRASVISLNQEEASACVKRPLQDDADLRRAGNELKRRLGCRTVLITRHQHGMAVFSPSGFDVVASRARDVFDVTGAGDTVIAITGMGLAAGGSVLDSVRLANIAAGIEVGKLGCALVSRDEIAAGLKTA